jgi:hypothetical protein
MIGMGVRYNDRVNPSPINAGCFHIAQQLAGAGAQSARTYIHEYVVFAGTYVEVRVGSHNTVSRQIPFTQEFLHFFYWCVLEERAQ